MLFAAAKPQCPFNWIRHHSGADTLLLTEQDLMSFYEAEELNLTVDWKCLDVGNGIASPLASTFDMWNRPCSNALLG